jgi:hypothetical protein
MNAYPAPTPIHVRSGEYHPMLIAAIVLKVRGLRVFEWNGKRIKIARGKTHVSDEDGK